MNPHIDDKPNLTKEEYNELEKLISNGKRNFSNETLFSAEYLHPLNAKMSHIPTTHTACAPYLFRCQICSDMNLSIQWYQIILASVGGTIMYQPHSKISNLQRGFNGQNLAKIKKDDKTDYQNSSLNLFEEGGKIKGYMCDHCRDSIND
jgi:hypothetical protein